MKLLVSWMDELRTYVTREFYYIMQDLIQAHGWRHLEPHLLSKDPASARSTLLDTLGEIPEAILFWETYDLCIALMPALRELGCLGYLFADDLHQLWGSEHLRDVKLQAFSACDTILSTYATVFEQFYPELDGGRKVVWTPHSASPDFVLPFNPEPENAILLSGAIGEHYPLRGRMRDLQEEGRYAIALQEHPGYVSAYDYERDARVGAGYARNIHRYRAAFNDAATFRYIVAKHFEIPATGSLLLTDGVVREPLSQLGFIENVHYVPVSLENLEDQLRYVLDPHCSPEIDAIRARGQQLVLSRHQTSHRAKLIDTVCAP
jgi:hypothetical protein